MLGTALLVAITIAGCGGGGSSSTSTTSSKTSATNSADAQGPTSATGATGSALARRTALTTCLKKYGVTLPSFGGGFGGTGGTGRRFGATGATGRRFGATGATGRRFAFGATGASGRPGGFPGAGGGFASNPKLAQALQKCGGFGSGGFGGGRFGATGPAALGGAAIRTQLATFVSCMKGKGINLPTPNLSGTGSVFGTSVNTKSSKFRTAFAGCQSTLPASLRGAGAAPPAA